MLAPDPAALAQVLDLALDLAARIPGCPPPRAEALLALPGVLRPAATETTGRVALPPSSSCAPASPRRWPVWSPPAPPRGRGLPPRCPALLDEIAALHAAATGEAADQPAQQRARMLDSVAALLGETPPCRRSGSPRKSRCSPPAPTCARSSTGWRATSPRRAHCWREAGAVGRRFDFLVQEFNREANTLCSKSASAALTATGLKLKATIEQLREQVQNIE